MKCTVAVAIAGATVWLVGCASAPRVVVAEPVGPAPAGTDRAEGHGSMAIYSAHTLALVDVNEAEWRYNNDFGENRFLHQPAHTGYTIYTQDDELFRHVRNAHDPDDATPTLVSLPAGSYKVQAQAINCDSRRVNVLLSVVIQPGQTTVAHLDGPWTPPPGPYPSAEFATLPCGRIIGWRASQAGLASNPRPSQAN